MANKFDKLRSTQNGGGHFVDIFKNILLKRISIQISLKFVPGGLMNTKAIVCSDDGLALSRHYLNQWQFSLLTHICIFWCWCRWVIVARWRDWARMRSHTALNTMHFQIYLAYNTYIYATIQTYLLSIDKLLMKSRYRFTDMKSHLCTDDDGDMNIFHD